MDIHKESNTFLYELWYSYSERILERIISICELDKDQEEALRLLYLRPNDFVLEFE
jgi:hypothetical protein